MAAVPLSTILTPDQVSRVKGILGFAEGKNSPFVILRNAFLDHERIYCASDHVMGWVPFDGFPWPTRVDAKGLRSLLTKTKGEVILEEAGTGKIRVAGEGGTKKRPTLVEGILGEAERLGTEHWFPRNPWPLKASQKTGTQAVTSVLVEDLKEGVSFIRDTESWEGVSWPSGTWPTVYLHIGEESLKLLHRPRVDAVCQWDIPGITNGEEIVGLDPKPLSKAVGAMRSSRVAISVMVGGKEIEFNDGTTVVRVGTKA